MNSGFKTKSEEIEWRRAKILELKSQGLDQREISQILHVSPTTITFDLQYLNKEARKTIREYTTDAIKYVQGQIDHLNKSEKALLQDIKENKYNEQEDDTEEQQTNNGIF